MRFLIDDCVGRKFAEWLRGEGHDVVGALDRGPDPGDRLLLQWAVDESRILVTIDLDFGRLVFLDQQRHAGIVRLPDVPPGQRIALMKSVLEKHGTELESAAIVTVSGGRIRVSRRS
jgi:predicted nuclease of predicted toxin-antitoxin system